LYFMKLCNTYLVECISQSVTKDGTDMDYSF
jgi:hypothetical protein